MIEHSTEIPLPTSGVIATVVLWDGAPTNAASSVKCVHCGTVAGHWPLRRVSANCLDTVCTAFLLGLSDTAGSLWTSLHLSNGVFNGKNIHKWRMLHGHDYQMEDVPWMEDVICCNPGTTSGESSATEESFKSSSGSLQLGDGWEGLQHVCTVCLPYKIQYNICTHTWYIYIHINMNMNIYIYIHINMNMNIYIYMYIYIPKCLLIWTTSSKFFGCFAYLCLFSKAPTWDGREAYLPGPSWIACDGTTVCETLYNVHCKNTCKWIRANHGSRNVWCWFGGGWVFCK